MVHIHRKHDCDFEIIYTIQYGEKGTAYPENRPEIQEVYAYNEESSVCNFNILNFIENECPLFLVELDEILYEKHRYDTK